MEAELNGISLCDIPPHLMRDDLERRLPCGPRFVNKRGCVYGDLTVVGFAGFLGIYATWMVQCKCGARYIRRGHMLGQRIPDSKRTHDLGCPCEYFDGRSSHPLWGVWRGMLSRCRDEKNVAYHHYGGRGIYVCDRWKEDFKAFLDDMGERPSDKHSVDRIDNDGPYSPDNCRWATHAVQANNTRANRRITFNGETRNHSGWALGLGITRERFRQRVNKLMAIGADVTEAITTPPGETMPSFRGSHERYKNRRTQQRREQFGMKDQWFAGDVVVLKAGEDFTGSPESMTAALRVESSVRGGKSKTRALGEYVLFQHRQKTISDKSSGQTKKALT